ncbi:MAG: protein-L-isoaspartate(D-aspartate) O-methyltransferase [Bacteroidetes bacterium]|nr:protein-L-isoaspartate(D-aspartate) O-methyltransferase [Bacteroidota bacterium]
MIEDSFLHQGKRKKLTALLRQKGISDSGVLNAIGSIPRHCFMDSAFSENAYEDKAFSIAEGQTISQPYTVAFQSQLLRIRRGEKVLEIGTGSGYQSAVLCFMGASVYSIERHRKLHDSAKELLHKLNLKAHLIYGDGTLGLNKIAPFDKIVVTAGAPIVPDVLVKQLKIGGLLVIPVGNSKEQRMLQITRLGENETATIAYDGFAFVPLIGEHGWK